MVAHNETGTETKEKGMKNNSLFIFDMLVENTTDTTDKQLENIIEEDDKDEFNPKELLKFFGVTNIEKLEPKIQKEIDTFDKVKCKNCGNKYSLMSCKYVGGNPKCKKCGYVIGQEKSHGCW